MAFDYGLIAKYNGRNRILDRDQFLEDIIINTKINFEEVESKGKNVKKESTGFFEGIRKWGAQLISSG